MPTTSAPPRSKSSPAIAEIERLGFTWREVSEYDLTQLSSKRRVQVRESKHYDPPEAVQRFAVMMGETAFPPIIVTSDEWIVDGNTRVGARAVRKEKFCPAYVLDVEYGAASTKSKNELHLLAATLNAMAGTPLTAREIRENTARFIQAGWTSEQIGRAIGMRPAGITAVKKEIDATAKLRKVGMDANGSLKGASLRAFGAKEVLGLNDIPFKELAMLAADAGFNATEIVTLAKAARDSGSDTAAVELITKERQELRGRIRERELTGVGKPPVARQLRQHLGFVTKFVGREQELVETDPKVAATHMEALEQSVGVLQAVLKLQKG